MESDNLYSMIKSTADRSKIQRTKSKKVKLNDKRWCKNALMMTRMSTELWDMWVVCSTMRKQKLWKTINHVQIYGQTSTRVIERPLPLTTNKWPQMTTDLHEPEPKGWSPCPRPNPTWSQNPLQNQSGGIITIQPRSQIRDRAQPPNLLSIPIMPPRTQTPKSTRLPLIHQRLPPSPNHRRHWTTETSPKALVVLSLLAGKPIWNNLTPQLALVDWIGEETQPNKDGDDKGKKDSKKRRTTLQICCAPPSSICRPSQNSNRSFSRPRFGRKPPIAGSALI